jgi:NAD(P)-dependent dehydrogenase (short-subunit alcohol dehydrogenase family)
MPSALIIGNSDGIGLALTERLLGEGWRIVGVSRSASRSSAAGYAHHVVDVTAAEYPARLAAAVSDLSLDVCVYCAGIGEFLDLDNLADERRVFETNLIGAVATAQVIIPPMIRARHGHFIGLSSQADGFVGGSAPSYSASKAGLTTYLDGLGAACRPRGVHITVVRFGFVDTKMAKAPRRPFIISPAEAAACVRRCIDEKPARRTYPRRMAVLMLLLRLAVRLRGF